MKFLRVVFIEMGLLPNATFEKFPTWLSHEKPQKSPKRSFGNSPEMCHSRKNGNLGFLDPRLRVDDRFN